VLNEAAGEEEWPTVAYIPIVHKGKEAGAAQRASRRRRAILQRVIYLVFRSAVAASHVGVTVRIGGRNFRAFVRLLLYICDLPEKKALLCLKSGKTAHPCSMCKVSVTLACAPEALDAEDRDAFNVLSRQVESTNLRIRQQQPKRRLMLEKKDSAHSVIPALAGMAGLSTAPFLMYQMVGVDVLHVLELGVTRMLVHRLVRAFPHVCGKNAPVCGSTKGACRCANRRFEEMGKRCTASMAAPGYVPPFLSRRACVC